MVRKIPLYQKDGSDMTQKSNPKFRQPAEWELHRACWLAWPSHADLWQEDLPVVQAEFTALCRAIADPGTGKAPQEKLEILVCDNGGRAAAAGALGDLPVRFHQIPFGDIWLRDTAPIFVTSPQGDLAATRFCFNGWGGKYNLPGDDAVASRISDAFHGEKLAYSWVLEGGSIEVDGEGTCLTSRQCLLNPNRNPNLSQTEIETRLKESLGITKILWLQDGLLNDHTDGHIDTIARFAAPGVVLCMTPTTHDDPNRPVLEQIARDLEGFTDARDRKLKVIKIPSPGMVTNSQGSILPASYLNFYLANHTVIVPTYGVEADQAAVRAISECFPQRRTLGLAAKTILSGGGAFHCITQQEPLVPMAFQERSR